GRTRAPPRKAERSDRHRERRARDRRSGLSHALRADAKWSAAAASVSRNAEWACGRRFGWSRRASSKAARIAATMKFTAILFVACVLFAACGGDPSEPGMHCETPDTTCTIDSTKMGSQCVCVKDGKQSEGKVVQ